MKYRYCKFNEKIYEIVKIDKDKITLRNENYVVETNINTVQFLENINTKKSTVKVNVANKETVNEIMLRHLHKEEAISLLDKYIDDAIVAKLGRVRIIHGRHGGILRKAVHEYLKNHPFVKEFYLASYGEGDIGVTIAILGKKN